MRAFLGAVPVRRDVLRAGQERVSGERDPTAEVVGEARRRVALGLASHVPHGRIGPVQDHARPSVLLRRSRVGKTEDANAHAQGHDSEPPHAFTLSQNAAPYQGATVSAWAGTADLDAAPAVYGAVGVVDVHAGGTAQRGAAEHGRAAGHHTYFSLRGRGVTVSGPDAAELSGDGGVSPRTPPGPTRAPASPAGVLDPRRRHGDLATATTSWAPAPRRIPTRRFSSPAARPPTPRPG